MEKTVFSESMKFLVSHIQEHFFSTFTGVKSPNFSPAKNGKKGAHSMAIC